MNSVRPNHRAVPVNQRRNVLKLLRTFFELGGGMVGSSPMYGSSEAVMGHALNRRGRPGKGVAVIANCPFQGG